MNLAYAFVQPTLANPGTALEVEVIGAPVAAKVIPIGPFDPDLKRVRS